MNNQLRVYLVALISSFLLLSACGGGGSSQTAGVGGGGGGGIGGTGATARGSIDGFGSIFVNGVRYNTDSATITIDGQITTDDQLALGMIVTVQGEIDNDGINGTATSVSFNDDVQGPIASQPLYTGDNTVSFSVMGLNVIADRTSTVFANTSFDTLAVNNVVEVSGLFTGLGDLIASRIEDKGSFIAGLSEVEVKGFISNANNTAFTLGDFTVDAASADLSELDGGLITNGLQVEVKGTLNGSTITASRVESEDDLVTNNNNTNSSVDIEGIVSNFVSIADFEIASIPVDASNARFEPESLANTLNDNTTVDIEGTIIDGVLIATEVEAEDGNIEVEAPVQSVDIDANTITLGFINGTLSVNLNAATQLEDKTDVQDILSLDEINPGDFLEVRAYQGNNNELIATEIRRDEVDDQSLEGPVESIDANNSITVLGITFNTNANTDFEDENENSITSTQFYSSVAVGEIIKIRDREISDGTADDVEFEN